MRLTTEKIPVYALSALINGDYSGMEEEDIQNINEWLERSEIKEVICPTDEEYQPYFTECPAFGLATDVVDCQCVLEW